MSAASQTSSGQTMPQSGSASRGRQTTMHTIERVHKLPEHPGPTDDLIHIGVFSDDRTVREQVRLALGRKVAIDLPEVRTTEFATGPALIREVEQTHFDVIVMDAEAVPLGGLGLAHQMKDEIRNAPPVVLLVARQQDAWLAAWSRAEAISPYPIDPLRLPETVVEVLRKTRTFASPASDKSSH